MNHVTLTLTRGTHQLTREEGLNSIRAGYRVSKILAEKAAWDFIQTEQPNFALTTLCPPFVTPPPSLFT